MRQLLNGLSVGGTSLRAEECGEVDLCIPFKGSGDLGWSAVSRFSSYL